MPLPSRQLYALRLPGLTSTVPVSALVVSVFALASAAFLAISWPDAIRQYGAVVWILALVPPFLLSYHKGWKGALVAALAGMLALLGCQIVGSLFLGRSLDWRLAGLVALVFILVSLGAGVLSELLHRQRMRALYLAYADPLTELPNRRVLDFFLEHQFAAAQRGHPLAVVLFDVDEFKGFNDLHGHRAGDEALRRLTEVLDANTRLMNVSGRYGGEEFLSILPGESAEGARTFAERVRGAVAELEGPDGARFTLSAGVATFADGMQRSAELLDAADRALYAAKRAGGDGTALAEPASRPEALEPTDAVAAPDSWPEGD